jgi:hypothetical protein
MADKVEQEVIIKVSTDETGIGSGVSDLNKEIAKSGEATKSFKQQLKEAKEAALALSQSGRENTKEWNQAVQTIANLRDQQDVLNRSITAMDPGNRFQALNKIAGLGVGAIGGLTSSMELLGLSTSSAAETIAKLQSVQQLVSLFDQFGDSVDFLKPFLQNLGLMKVATVENTVAMEAQTVATTQATVATAGLSTAFKLLGIGLIVSAIVALVVYFKEIKQVVLEFIPGIRSLGLAFDYVKEKITDMVGITSAATRELDKLTKSVTKNNEAIDNQVAKLSAAGGQEEKIYALKAKRIENDLNVLRKKLEVEGKLSEDDLKNFKKLKLDKEVEDIKETKRINDKSKAEQDKVNAASKAASDKAKQVADAKRAKLKADSDAELKVIADNLKVSQKLIDDSKRTELQKAENDINEKYKLEIDLANKHKKDTLILEQAKETELAAVRKKSADEALKAKQDADDKVNEQIKKVVEKAKEDEEKAKQLAKEKKDKEAEELKTLLTKQTDAVFNSVSNVNKIRSQFEEESYVRRRNALQTQINEIQLLGDSATDAQKQKLVQAQIDIENLESNHSSKLESIERSLAAARLAIDNALKDGKLTNIEKVQIGLATAGALASEHTLAGKAMSIASTTISTYEAAQSIYASTAKIPFVGSILAPIAAATAVASGLATVKKIVSVKVPLVKGVSAGSSSSAPSFTPSSAPVINSTILNDKGTQDVRLTASTVKTDTNVVKAYVVEKDLDSKKRQDAFIERTSNI